MTDPMLMARSRCTRLLGSCVLLAGGIGASVLLAGGAAQAAACGGAVPAGTNCTITATLSLSAGALSLTSPTSLGWGATVNGTDLQLSDPTAADESYLVDDSTGTAAGWHVTVAATQFTTGGGTPSLLADATTFSTNGSLGSLTATVGPSATCHAGSTCTLPTDTTTYPVAIVTGAAVTPINIYDASATTGLGSITIGGSTAADPVGWWIAVPSNTLAGIYTSTVTLEIIAGP
jgi:hypothetical protein